MSIEVQVVYWRDIPAQVRIRQGRDRRSLPLGERFQDAIDQAAMRAGASGAEAYLEEWRTVGLPAREGDPESVLHALTAEIESRYPEVRLQELIARGGREA